MSAHAQTHLTPEEYLELERAAAGPLSEYYRGRMYEMPPSTFNHALILSHLTAALHQELRGRPEGVVCKGRRVLTPGGLYAYPDAMVLSAPVFAHTDHDVLLNPLIIVEVISRVTEAYDRGFKFIQYRTIESLQEVVLVSQTEPRLEVYGRHPSGGWLLTESAGLDASCRFESINCQIALADIYEKVTFNPDEVIPPRPPAN